MHMRIKVVATPIVNSPRSYIFFWQPSRNQTITIIDFIDFVTTELGVMRTAEGHAAPKR